MKTASMVVAALLGGMPAAVAAQETHGSHGGHDPGTAGMVSAADAVMSGATLPRAENALM